MDNFKGPEPVGCWESFIKGISSIWSTIDLRTRKETDIALSKSDPEKGIRSAEDEEKEKKQKALQTVAREFGIYMVFLGILCWGKLLDPS